MKKKTTYNEIDLLPILLLVSKNIFKIFSITLIFCSLALTYFFFSKNKYEAVTKIQPISINEEYMYSPYNSFLNTISSEKKNFDFFVINRHDLHNLFLRALEDNQYITEIINKYESSNNQGKDIVKKIKILPPIEMDPLVKRRSELRSYWVIKNEPYDKENWEKLLSYIENEINNKIRLDLIKNINFILENKKRLDIFEIENINRKINNAKKDYEFDIINRLAFLKEQALIARELKIKNNTLEVENFNTPSVIISNLQTSKPYYMRGYSFIEKEIELIESRANKDAFTNNLFDLEKEKRSLLESKKIIRVEKLFLNTPIFKPEKFKAANIDYDTTKYKSLGISLVKLIFLASIAGILFGIVFVLIINISPHRK